MIFRRRKAPSVDEVPDEVPVLQPEEAKWILDVMQEDRNEHGYALPHKGGEWPPYDFVDADARDKEWCRFSNELYLKLLRIAGIPIDALWRLPAK